TEVELAPPVPPVVVFVGAGGVVRPLLREQRIVHRAARYAGDRHDACWSRSLRSPLRTRDGNDSGGPQSDPPGLLGTAATAAEGPAQARQAGVLDRTVLTLAPHEREDIGVLEHDSPPKTRVVPRAHATHAARSPSRPPPRSDAESGSRITAA